MTTAQIVSIGIALVGGMTLGLTLSALLGANGREDAADIGRIDLLETEHVFVSRAGGYIIIFDGADMKQLAIGKDLRSTIDHAALKLLDKFHGSRGD